MKQLGKRARETCEYLDFICNDWHVACLQLPASMNILRSVCDTLPA